MGFVSKSSSNVGLRMEQNRTAIRNCNNPKKVPRVVKDVLGSEGRRVKLKIVFGVFRTLK